MRHTTLYNQSRYFKRKLKDGTLDEEKAVELERVLNMRDLSIHTGGVEGKNNNKSVLKE